MLKKIKTQVALFCMLLLLLTSCTETETGSTGVDESASAESTVKETVYTIGDVQFTIDGGWAIDTTDTEIGITFFEDSDNGIVARMAIQAPQNLGGQKMNKASIGLMLSEMLVNIDAAAELTHVQEETLAQGGIVYTMEAELTVNNVPIKAYIWLVKYEDEICMVMYSATVNEYETYLVNAQEVVETAKRL